MSSEAENAISIIKHNREQADIIPLKLSLFDVERNESLTISCTASSREIIIMAGLSDIAARHREYRRRITFSHEGSCYFTDAT